MSETRVRYPLTQEPVPGDGSSVLIAEGIHWLRMPLDPPLRWINVWALEDGDGWTVIDTGVWSPETEASWRHTFDRLLGGKPITRIIATHMHPDHCGSAGWLAQQFPARLWMSRLEYLTGRLMASDKDAVPQDVIDFYIAAGWDEQALVHYRSRYGYIGRQIYPLPSGYRRLTDGEWLQIGNHWWTVVMGSGHSPEHACLHCPARKLFISGDQVLPKISSNVSVFPTEPDANPLSDWISSLRRVGGQLSEDTFCLPAHNSPFLDIHNRLAQLLAHHDESLAKLLDALRRPLSVVDVFHVLFKKPITQATLHMATGEALAHLNYLKSLGKATGVPNAAGVIQWQAT